VILMAGLLVYSGLMWIVCSLDKIAEAIQQIGNLLTEGGDDEQSEQSKQSE
jgi:hypothetical protein